MNDPTCSTPFVLSTFVSSEMEVSGGEREGMCSGAAEEGGRGVRWEGIADGGKRGKRAGRDCEAGGPGGRGWRETGEGQCKDRMEGCHRSRGRQTKVGSGGWFGRGVGSDGVRQRSLVDANLRGSITRVQRSGLKKQRHGMKEHTQIVPYF